MSRKARAVLAIGLVASLVAFWWWGGPRARWQVARQVPERPWSAQELSVLAEEVAAAEERARAGDRTALADLAGLYHASAWGKTAAEVYAGLHALEPANPVWSFYAERAPTDWDVSPDEMPEAVRTWQLQLPGFAVDVAFAERLAGETAPRDPQLAQRWMHRAIELEPKQGSLHLKSALLWERLRDQVKAKEAYERAVELEPTLTEAWARLITLYRAIGDTAGVLRALREGLAASPDSPLLLLERGRLAQQRGRNDDALRDFSRVIEIEPSMVPAWIESAQIHFARDDVKTGVTLLERLLEADPDNPIALVMLTFAAISQNDQPTADRWLARVAAQPLIPEVDRARLLGGYRRVFGVDFEPEQ